MPRPSKIDKLPVELKNLIGELRQAGASIDEIMGKLRELKPDIDISRTGLGVHIQDLDRMVENMQNSRAVADALAARFGNEPDTRISRASIEMLQSAIMKLMVTSDGSGLASDELLQLSLAVKSLSAATKSDVETRAKIRREMADQAVKAAEKAIDASAAPDKAALVQRVRQEIYGLTT
jgi:hypothetical protein